MSELLTIGGVLIAVVILGRLVWKFKRSHGVSRELKAVATEHELTPSETVELGKLVAALPELELREILERRMAYNRAVDAYLKELRSRTLSRPLYLPAVQVLAGLRVKLHPPAPLDHYLTSTRDLVPGFDCRVLMEKEDPIAGRLWFVSEDSIIVGLDRNAPMPELKRRDAVVLEIVLPGQGRYAFKSRVLSPIVKPRPGLRLEHTDDSTNPNRRQHLRERVKFRLDVWQTEDEAEEPVQGLAVNLSGGGVGFLLRAPLEPGTEIRVQLPPIVTGGYEKSLWAQIVWSKARDTVGTVFYGARWVNMGEHTRESVIRYVQNEHLKRSRL